MIENQGKYYNWRNKSRKMLNNYKIKKSLVPFGFHLRGTYMLQKEIDDASYMLQKLVFFTNTCLAIPTLIDIIRFESNLIS